MIPNIIKTLHFVEPLRNAFCRLGWCVDCLRAFTERSKVMKHIRVSTKCTRIYKLFFVQNWIPKPKNSTAVPSCAKKLKLLLAFFLRHHEHHVRNTAREHGPRAEFHYIVNKYRKSVTAYCGTDIRGKLNGFI